MICKLLYLFWKLDNWSPIAKTISRVKFQILYTKTKATNGRAKASPQCIGYKWLL